MIDNDNKLRVRVPPVLSIKDWKCHFENNRTNALVEMRWVPIPNKFDGDGYTEVMSDKNGASVFAAWILMVEVASKCAPRGVLIRSCGKPYDAESLSRLTRAPAELFEKAIPLLLKVGWLESQPVDDEDDTTMLQDGAVETQVDAAKNGAEKKDRRKKKPSRYHAASLPLAHELINNVGKATGRKMISTAAQSQAAISKLLNRGITEDEIRTTIEWLTTDNLKRTAYQFVVASGNALLSKWDNIQAAMNDPRIQLMRIPSVEEMIEAKQRRETLNEKLG